MIIALESASSDPSLALAERDGSVLASDAWEGEGRQASELLPHLLVLLARAGRELAGTSALAVGIGPGSFTGLRVSMSLAKGLALALDVPLVGVPSLEAWLAAEPEARAAIARAGAQDAFVLLRGEALATGRRRGRAGAPRRRVAGRGRLRGWERVCPPRRHLPAPWRGVGRAPRLATADRGARWGRPRAARAVVPARPARHRPGGRRGPLMAIGTPLVIERMRMGDVAAVIEIERLSFSSPWPAFAFEQELTANRLAHYVVARSDGRVVGFAGIWLMVDEAHVTTFGVHPDHRRRGVGRRLLLRLAEMAIELGTVRMTLEVRVSNEPAQALYRSFGFRVAGRRIAYYSDDGEDALVMTTASLASPTMRAILDAERLRAGGDERW